MSPSGGDKASATVSRTCDHAICEQLCSPSARSSPLGRAQVAVDVAEQGGGRAETVPVGDGRPLAPFPVLAGDAERAVALLAEGGAALGVWGLKHGRVHLVLPLVP